MGLQKVRSVLNGDVDMIAFADNNLKIKNIIYKGVEVFNPKDIQKYKHDFVIMGNQYNIEIKKQLLQLGTEDGKLFEMNTNKNIAMQLDKKEDIINISDK